MALLLQAGTVNGDRLVTPGAAAGLATGLHRADRPDKTNGI
jgi:hypothetical protein